MKDNNYAIGNCFTCAKEIIEGEYKGVITLPRSLMHPGHEIETLYCNDHVEDAIIKIDFERNQRMLDCFYESERRRESVNQIYDSFYSTNIAKSWGKPVTQSIIDGIKSVINRFKRIKVNHER